jgi:glycosyltransferase involved in cell wall biosynthesis
MDFNCLLKPEIDFSMLKIMHLISSLDVGGTEMALYRLLSQMDRQHFQNTVVSLIEVGPVGEKIQALGIPVHSLGMQRGRPSPLGIWRLAHVLRHKRPDILQTWLYHADLLGLVTAALVRVPCTIWNLRASDMDMSKYRRLSGWTVHLCKLLSGMPQAVVVNSEAGRAFHTQHGYHPRRWVLIPPGIDTQAFRPDAGARLEVRRELGLTSEALLIGLVARFDPMKDHATFLRAAGQLAHIETHVQFVLVGTRGAVDNPELSALIAQAQLHGRVHLLGLRSDTPRLMAALDIASLSSISEGFPNVVGEAMACGVPCVVTDVGDSARIVGETGIVVPSRNPRALVEGWQKMIGLGTAGRQQLGQAARERIQRYYSLEQIVQQYETFYISLVGKE